MERKGATPSLWQRQTLSTKGESDGLSSSKIIISHSAFVDAQRFGKRTAHAVFQASPASHDSTNALIFKRETKRELQDIHLAVASVVSCVDKRSEEHTSELQSHSDLVCRLLLEKKKKKKRYVENWQPDKERDTSASIRCG